MISKVTCTITIDYDKLIEFAEKNGHKIHQQTDKERHDKFIENFKELINEEMDASNEMEGVFTVEFTDVLED